MSRIDTVRRALERGERAERLLGGRNFDANYWRNARRQLTVIGRDLDIEKRLNAALCEFVDEPPAEEA